MAAWTFSELNLQMTFGCGFSSNCSGPVGESNFEVAVTRPFLQATVGSLCGFQPGAIAAILLAEPWPCAPQKNPGSALNKKE